MSKIYDDWERLVAAVLRRELIRKICHENSRTPSLVSSASSFSSASFDFTDLENGFFSKSSKYVLFQELADIKIRLRPESKEHDGQLVLFKDSPFAFDLQELLTAPSFVLGEELERVTTTYVVGLKEDVMFVVKRWERGGVTPVEFERRVKVIGRNEHENVVKLRGYYLSDDESLGFFDHFPQGSVYTMLHAKKGEHQVHLDWKARVRIAVGAAKGLAHIHRQCGGSFVHNNITSLNIFLNSQKFGCVANIVPAVTRISQYTPPEVSIEAPNLSQASDVYSFGVVLIELISGRSPLNYYYFYTGRYTTYVEWAIHKAQNEWPDMVFDKGVLKDCAARMAMRYMWAAAFCCVEEKPEERPNIGDVVRMLALVRHY